ncbi:hypothetical protein [Umezawaea sp. Da 62-37]|uniref:sensor histidine kinase n=1 Tax=Umezawaea sp. Da 62-37 TaxID=3075927 RepID=UPI0028F70C74|nr:hypothetical protein [Umezawaea sp. Da 62-37]WNV87965.1 hypothetical protein RM788_06665 [Umezawaea sp. Da 62-37]
MVSSSSPRRVGRGIEGAAWSRVVVLLPMAVSVLVAEAGYRTPFLLALLGYAVWTTGWLWWVRGGSAVPSWHAHLTAAADVGAITVLSLFSGGPSSEVGYAYVLLPFAAIPSYRPRLTAALGGVSALAYLFLLLVPLRPTDIGNLDPARGAPYDILRAFGFAGYLLWFGVVCTVLTSVLAHRGARIATLLKVQEQLVTDVISAEERERAALADALHDSAVQNLMAAKLELSAPTADPELSGRLEPLLAATIGELRQAVFDLHPRVLSDLGVAAALETLCRGSGERGGFRVEFRSDLERRYRLEPMLYSVARELLSNAVRHSGRGSCGWS